MWIPSDPDQLAFTNAYLDINRKYQSGTLSEVERQNWRESQFLKVLAKTRNSAFYAEHVAHDAIHSLADLAKIPFTTKDHLRSRMSDMLSAPLRDALYYYETTGTTGAATPCPRDYKEVLASNCQVTENWRAVFDEVFGTGSRPIVGLMGPTEVHSFGDTLGTVCQNLNLCNFKIWPYSPVIGFPKALQLLRDHKIEVIVCTPGVAMNLIKAAQHYGFDLERDFAVKTVFLTGEMSTPGLMQNIGSIWGARVFNCLYGSQEAFIMASARGDGQMYIADPNYIVEVIDPASDQSLGETGQGELCVTMLMDGIKPLLRYRTGDLVSIRDTGKKGPERLQVDVIGRTRDRITLNDRLYSAFDIETAILEPVSHCIAYQIIIDQTDGVDHLEIRVEFSKAAPDTPAMAQAIALRCLADLGTAADVIVVSDIDQVVTTAAFVSWKAARIMDRRQAEPDAETLVSQRLAKKRGY
jgi:phenylacetate-CoA ligase